MRIMPERGGVGRLEPKAIPAGDHFGKPLTAVVDFAVHEASRSKVPTGCSSNSALSDNCIPARTSGMRGT